MYDEIFKVFDVVKSHCYENGNRSFEESAVFELLENLYPTYGSAQTIAIVTEMIDAQGIRDFKDSSNDSKVEISDSDISNDADSIIEVQVPRKVHPIVDLTNNSSESDDAVIVENSINLNLKNNSENHPNIELDNSSSGVSDNEYHGWSDPDNSKLFEDECWNQTDQKIIRNSDATFIPNFLTTMGEGINKPNSNQLEGDQNNSSIADERDNSEMLEENNNDPNNNLDGVVLDDESVNNNNNNNELISEVRDPMPGCSKDTDTEINLWQKNEKSLLSPTSHQSTSPVPGCSKDFDDSHNFASVSIDFDESIRKDAICIQEITPWANLDTIHSILKKHENSPNRKQLTLWDLMNEVSNQTNTKVVKRKQNDDLCRISKKSPKTDDIDESSLDLPSNMQLNNTTCNESSNDSQSSRMSEYNESISSELTDRNQKELMFPMESSKTLLFNKKDSSNSNNCVNFLNKLTNNAKNCIDETANLMLTEPIKNQFFDNSTEIQVPKLNYNYSPTVPNHPIKKERNETIVSGSLKDSNTLPVNACVSANDSGYQSVVNINEMNDFFGESSIKYAKEKEVEKNDEHFSQEGPFNRSKDASKLKPNGAEIIKPSKLGVQQKSSFQISTPPTTTSYIRPSTFSPTTINSNINQQKIAVRKDLGYHTLEQLHVVNNKPITQLPQPKRSRLKVKLGSFPANIHNPFSSKPNNGHVLTVKPATAGEIRPVLLQEAFQTGSPRKPVAAPRLQIAQTGLTIASSTLKHKGLAPSSLLPTSIKAATLLKPSLPDQPKAPPTATVTSSAMQPWVVTLPKKTTSGATIGAQKIPVQLPDSSKAQPTATITSSSVPTQIANLANKTSTYGVTIGARTVPVQPSVEALDPIIYNKLRSMFPDVRKSYMKKICLNPPGGANPNKEQLLNILIDHLLREGHEHLQPINFMVHQEQKNKINTLSVDEKYEYLLGVFPDADPTYLRDFVEKRCNTEEMLEEFIQQKLEKKNYPTKDQYLAKIKITEQIKQYTADFVVEQFLDLFSDPFKHFEDRNRKCDYQPIAMEFLKAFFNKNKVNTISRQYLRSGYNLSLTAKALTEIGPDMKSKRMTSEMPTENIPLLQEMAFIKNKQNIQNHIDTLKTKEEELFKSLKEKNLLLTCECCFNDECMPTKSAECNSDHVFCFDCIIRGTESKLADGEAHVKCFTNCDSEFSLATLQKVLPPTTFSALLKKRQAAEIMAAGMDGLVSCPFCHFASIPPPEDKIFKCLNPECMKETCRQCKELNHIPLRCDELAIKNKTEKARHLIEEKMTQALLRTCYECKKQFYKEEGCNKMRCNCGALMCYLCDKPVKGYEHFNPQGGLNINLCPLWSDDLRLNAEAVRKVGETMQKAMLKADPNLKIDMDSILPKLPPRSKGAHDDIPNANQLPEHVRRLAAP